MIKRWLLCGLLLAGCTPATSPNGVPVGSSLGSQTVEIGDYSLTVPGDWTPDVAPDGSLAYLRSPGGIIGTLNRSDVSSSLASGFKLDEAYAKLLFESSATGAMIGDGITGGSNVDGSLTSDFKPATLGGEASYRGDYAFQKAAGGGKKGIGAVIFKGGVAYSFSFIDSKGGDPAAQVNPILNSLKFK